MTAPLMVGLRLLLGTDVRVVWGACGLALAAGVLDRAAILALIDLATGAGAAFTRTVVIAALAALGTLASARWAYLYGLRAAGLVSDAVVGRLLQHIAQAEWGDIDRIGPAPLQAAISREAEALLEAASTAFLALPAAMTVLLTLAWLAAEQPESVLIIGGVAGFAFAVPWRSLSAVHAGQSGLAQAETAFDAVSARFAANPLAGIFDRQAAEAVRARDLWPVIDDAARAEASAGQARANWSAWHQWLGLAVIVLLFETAPPDPATGAWRVALLLAVATLSPVRSVLAALPALCRAGEASGRLAAIAGTLQPAAPMPVLRAPAWQTIEFRDVTYVHRDGAGAAVSTVGPLNLHVRQGELMAVIGGRGSGKTTLTRLLCGLYAPSAGQILLDGQPAAPALLRSLCGGVLAGPRPMRRVRPPAAADRARIQDLLAELELDHTIQFDSGGAVPAGLTESQLNRVALLAAEIDGRPLRIYDEWAASQEPRFRDRFYGALLRKQIARGCTIIVIEDDPDAAAQVDRAVRMAAGRIVADGPGGAPLAAAAS